VSIVAVVGPTSSTTALALASTWPSRPGGQDPVLLEADPCGGVYAAWLDVPAMPGLASAVAAPGTADLLEHSQRARGGLTVVVSPMRSLEAMRTVHEARRLLPSLTRDGRPVVADCGAYGHLPAASPVLDDARMVVVCVRQRAGSPSAVAADLERAAECCDALAARATPTVLAIVGDRPFDAAEVAAFVAGRGDVVPCCEIADDPWSASILAGRLGSARRLRRGPLMASAARAAVVVAGQLADASEGVR
jgi:hypothetical protein